MPLDFSDLLLHDRSPIYLQIIEYVKYNIVVGNITCGDELPSRRFLSTMLSVNPSTIQKAYKQLEEEGFVVSYAGAKSLIRYEETQISALRKNFIDTQASQFVENLKQLGIRKEMAHDLLDQYWNTSQERKDSNNEKI